MYPSTSALRAIAVAFRRLANDLDAILDADREPERAIQEGEAGANRNGASRTFDPQYELPPVTPSPTGRREEVDWCGLVFFGKLRAINVREGRGATSAEQLAIARAAGYQDRRAFAGWPWTWKDIDDQRWITEDGDISEEDKARGRISGMAFLVHYAAALDVKLPDELWHGHKAVER